MNGPICDRQRFGRVRPTGDIQQRRENFPKAVTRWRALGLPGGVVCLDFHSSTRKFNDGPASGLCAAPLLADALQSRQKPAYSRKRFSTCSSRRGSSRHSFGSTDKGPVAAILDILFWSRGRTREYAHSTTRRDRLRSPVARAADQRTPTPAHHPAGLSSSSQPAEMQALPQPIRRDRRQDCRAHRVHPVQKKPKPLQPLLRQSPPGGAPKST